MLCLISTTVLAATDHPLTDGGSIDLATDCSAGDTVTVAAGASVTITGSQTNIAISCGSGASVTLSGVTITNSGDYICPLTFWGTGNSLILAAGTVNTLTASSWEPAVCVEGSTELTISGNGKLITTGGQNGAGIGGGNYCSGGSIMISGGTVTAMGGVTALSGLAVSLGAAVIIARKRAKTAGGR